MTFNELNTGHLQPTKGSVRNMDFSIGTQFVISKCVFKGLSFYGISSSAKYPIKTKVRINGSYYPHDYSQSSFSF